MLHLIVVETIGPICLCAGLGGVIGQRGEKIQDLVVGGEDGGDRCGVGVDSDAIDAVVGHSEEGWGRGFGRVGS